MTTSSCCITSKYYALFPSWRCGVAVRHWTCDQQVVGSIATGTKLCNNLRQVVRTYVPLSSSSITWYWSKDVDVFLLGRWPQAWRKVMAAYRRGMTQKVTRGLTACIPGSAPGPTLRNKYGRTLPFTFTMNRVGWFKYWRFKWLILTINKIDRFSANKSFDLNHKFFKLYFAYKI